MKKVIFCLMVFFSSLTIVGAINSVKVTLVIDEENHVKKQIIIDNKNNELVLKMPKSGKIPGNIYGYHVNLLDVNSNTKYNKKSESIYLSDLKNQGRVVLNYEYDINFKQNDGYEYFDILEGIDKNIDVLNIQIKFENDYEVNDLKVFINNKITEKYTNYVKGNGASIKINELKTNDVVSFQVKRNIKSSPSTLTIISFIFPIVCLILSIILWLFYGKDRREVVEKKMNPVRQLSLLEVARLYNEKITKSDVISMLFSLCSKGFVQIVETKDDLKLVKLKKYTGHSYSEALLYDAIFIKSYVGTFDEAINKKKKEYNDEVSVKDVKIVRTIERIIANENINSKKYEYFERDTTSKRNLIMGMAVTSLVLVTINPFIVINNSIFFILALILEVLSFYIINKFISYVDLNKIRKYLMPVLLTVILFVLIFAFIFGTNSIYEVAYLLGVVCVIGMMILAKYMPKRNVYGDKLFNKMEGFRKLLEEGTKEEYKGVINTNSDYYYDMISYYYIFGDKDIVSKRFKSIVDKECTWYKSYKKFDFNNFNKTCDVIFEVLRENN